MEKLAVIIPAAGSGSRMGSSKPKPFLLLGDKSILWYTISAFAKVESVIQIIIPTSKDWISEVQEICNSIPNQKIQFKVILGGSERQFSIQNGLDHIKHDVTLVAVHDAVRPFISAELIMRTAHEASKFGGAIVGVPAKDTIKKVNSSLSILNTPNRKELWQAQTPQIFRKSILIQAYKSAIENKFVGTDDASLVERVGGEVKLVEGDRENLKITYPVDLKIAEMILKEEGRL
jgi:2-C-methyl-D-erythritol 4-phosphate cytidylyltransferase